FSDISISYDPYDVVSPPTNASSISMAISNGGRSISDGSWNNSTMPYFSWTAGADDGGGSGLKGYCLYLGTDSAGDPATAKGILGTSPVSTSGSTCQFIVSSTSINLSTSGYLGSAFASGSTYYLNIKAIDNGYNVYSGSSTAFSFQEDNTVPTNAAYISAASGSFGNVTDMNFNWPSSGGSAASDSHSEVLGYQYQLNGSTGTWLGTETDADCGVDYIPKADSEYAFTALQDENNIVSGANVIYFRAIDTACNTSSDATIRTASILYGGAAPTFLQTDSVTISPSSSSTNSFALSWPAATPSGSNSIQAYYYVVNNPPPSTYATLSSNASTYISTGTSRTVSAAALPNVNKGTNTVYVVAVDDATTTNYSPSNYITGTFTLNSTDPDNVGNLVASDSSIKSESQWNVTLTWTAPSYKGAGNLSYLVYRSADGSSFSQVGTTTGLSYVDNTPESQTYYYKIYSKDGANAQSSGTNAVSILPTGKYTSAPGLESGPTTSSITTKKATISWSTDRQADSKVSYGTSSDSYGDVDASNTDLVSSHSITLINLAAGTTYYYKVKWTDEDGNSGSSDEKNFSTDTAPSVKDVGAKDIGLSGAIIHFTSIGASKVKIYYGTTTTFGGALEVSTSSDESSYTSEISELDDGVKYYYKINTFDSEGNEYEGTILDFTTLPRPKLSNIRLQEVTGTFQPTMLISWTSNTEVSSIVSFYPEGKPQNAKDEVNITLKRGEHKTLITGLFAQTPYILVVKGRDKAGNEALSDSQKFCREAVLI
ncbi:MAG: fibronectin type III domain-containing protein, partial [Candidatus Roizmanbacteria bacterium]